MSPFKEKPRSLLVRQARRAMSAMLRRGAKHLTEDALRAPAIVFSPHPDDESLGCGGLIIKKRQAGARVVVVYVTDGHSSHLHSVKPALMVETRTREAIEACSILGVSREDILFLNATDGMLLDQWQAYVPEAVEILDRCQPTQVFVPHRREPRADHLGTYRLVHEAVRQWNCPVAFFEYLVWYWNHWPWAIRPLRGFRDFLEVPWTLWSGFRIGTALLRDQRAILDVSDILDQKRLALEQHRTQMDRPAKTPQWLTLRDVWDGGLLAACFQGHEFFEYRLYRPTKPSDSRPDLRYAHRSDRQLGTV